MNPFALLGELTDIEEKNALDVWNPRQQCPVVLIGSIAAFLNLKDVVRMNAICYAWCHALSTCQVLHLHGTLVRWTATKRMASYNALPHNLRRHVTSLFCAYNEMLSLSHLKQFLESWTHLKRLTFEFDASQVFKLKGAFQFPPKLEYLNVSWNDVVGETKCVAHFIVDSLQKLQFLRTFILNKLCSCHHHNQVYILQTLSALPSLHAVEIGLNHRRFTPDEIAQLKQMLNLRVIDSNQSNSDLQALCTPPHQLHALEEISVCTLKLNRETLNAMASLPALTKLYPRAIHTDAFEALGRCFQLRELGICFHGASVAEIKTLGNSLKQLKNLQKLKLEEFTLSEANITLPCLFENTPDLTDLDLFNVIVSDFGIFTPLRMLKKLNIKTTLQLRTEHFNYHSEQARIDQCYSNAIQDTTQLMSGMLTLNKLTNTQLEELAICYDLYILRSRNKNVAFPGPSKLQVTKNTNGPSMHHSMCRIPTVCRTNVELYEAVRGRSILSANMKWTFCPRTV